MRTGWRGELSVQRSRGDSHEVHADHATCPPPCRAAPTLRTFWLLSPRLQTVAQLGCKSATPLALLWASGPGCSCQTLRSQLATAGGCGQLLPRQVRSQAGRPKNSPRTLGARSTQPRHGDLPAGKPSLKATFLEYASFGMASEALEMAASVSPSKVPASAVDGTLDAYLYGNNLVDSGVGACAGWAGWWARAGLAPAAHARALLPLPQMDLTRAASTRSAAPTMSSSPLGESCWPWCAPLHVLAGPHENRPARGHHQQHGCPFPILRAMQHRCGRGRLGRAGACADA